MVYTSWKIASQLSQRSFAPSLWCLHIGFIQPVSMFLLLPNQHQLPCVLELPRVADITTLQVNHTLKQVVPAQPLLRSQHLSPVVVFAAPTHHLLPSVLVRGRVEWGCPKAGQPQVSLHISPPSALI